MEKRAPRIDSVNVLLEACIEAYPISSFIISLYQQYVRRGSLSKKQLQGLYDKASKIEGLAPGKLAAVEVIIKKMPTRTKSHLPANKPLYEKDETTGQLIDSVLRELPTHKTALYLRSKFVNNETLTPGEIGDLKRIKQFLESRRK